MWGLAILLWMAGQQPTSGAFVVDSTRTTMLMCPSKDGTLKLCDEPIDVPAIQIGAHMGCRATSSYVCVDSLIPDYSCADKSRVLLTSEDGKNWCHKIQP